MSTQNMIVLVLVVAVAGGALYFATRPDPLAAGFGAAPPVADPNRPEAAYYIEAVGGAIGGVLGGVGSLISSAYGGGGAHSTGGGTK